jgi:hypothetical protein
MPYPYRTYFLYLYSPCSLLQAKTNPAGGRVLVHNFNIRLHVGRPRHCIPIIVLCSDKDSETYCKNNQKSNQEFEKSAIKIIHHIDIFYYSSSLFQNYRQQKTAPSGGFLFYFVLPNRSQINISVKEYLLRH